MRPTTENYEITQKRNFEPTHFETTRKTSDPWQNTYPYKIFNPRKTHELNSNIKFTNMKYKKS